MLGKPKPFRIRATPQVNRQKHTSCEYRGLTGVTPYQLYWRWKSRPKRLGRPSIPREHIAFIRRMSADNLSWGEDKIDEELRVKFGVSHSTRTIRRYRVRRRPRSDGQKWRTFIKNHSHELFACDFMTQYTAMFTTV